MSPSEPEVEEFSGCPGSDGDHIKNSEGKLISTQTILSPASAGNHFFCSNGIAD